MTTRGYRVRRVTRTKTIQQYALKITHLKDCYTKKACYLYPGHELGPGQLIDWLTEIDISPNEKIPVLLNFSSSQHVLKEPLQDLLLIIYMDWCLEMT